MATQTLIPAHLSYDDEDDVFKWKGSVDELKATVNSILDCSSDNGETSEDKAHRAVTYKVGDASVRLYTTTNKLKLFGPNHNQVREGFHKLLNSTPSPLSPEREPATSGSVPLPNIPEVLNSLLEDVAALKSEVNVIKAQASVDSFPPNRTEQLQQDLKFSRQEIEALRDEIKIHKNTILKLQSERDSLVTTINILVADRDALAAQSTPERVPPELKEQEGQKEQWETVKRNGKSKTKAKTKQPETPHESSTPKTTTVVVGDSIIGKLEGWKMANRQNRVIINSFPGATAEDMMDHTSILSSEKNPIGSSCMLERTIWQRTRHPRLPIKSSRSASTSKRIYLDVKSQYQN